MINDAQPAEAGTKNVAHPEAAAPDKSEKIVFSKPNLEPPEIIEKLEKQGMDIDHKSALPYLEQVGGYGMKGYWYQWLNSDTKTFQEGVHFNHVIERYEFDRELRRATGDALERIELMVRAVISNVMSKHEGPHWFISAALFVPAEPDPAGGVQDSGKKKALIGKVAEEVDRMKRKPFIQHYRNKYSDPALPPSWAISECLSFGSWSTA